MLKSSLLIMRGDVAGAEKVLAAVPVDEPTAMVSARDRIAVLSSLVEQQLAQNKVADAGATADKLVEAAPGSPVALLMKGRVALAGGNADDAVTQFQKAVQRAPEFSFARVWLATAYMKQGNTALAETELQRVLQSAPDNVEARKLLAESQIRAGRAPAALETLQPLIAAEHQGSGRLRAGRPGAADGRRPGCGREHARAGNRWLHRTVPR